MDARMTHTLVVLEVSAATFTDIENRIQRVNVDGSYNNLFMHSFGGGRRAINMDKIAVQIERAEVATPDYDKAEVMQAALSRSVMPPEACTIGDAHNLMVELAKLGYTVQRVAP